MLVYAWFRDAGWSYQELPVGTFNAWGSDNGAGAAMRASEEMTYCNNPEYSFVYWEPGWNYCTPPKCRKLSVNEVATKGLGNVFFTTVYMEKQLWGWKCGDSSDATQRTDCTDRTGTVVEYDDGQCECFTEEAYYPVAVEKMAMKVEFGYSTTVRYGRAPTALRACLFTLLYSRPSCTPLFHTPRQVWERRRLYERAEWDGGPERVPPDRCARSRPGGEEHDP